jgi:hypothetical protein
MTNLTVIQVTKYSKIILLPMKNIVLCVVFIFVGFGVIIGWNIISAEKISRSDRSSIQPSVQPSAAYTFDQAPSESLRGTIATMSGQVQW